MNIQIPNVGFKSSVERLKDEALGRRANKKNKIMTGISYLDRVFRGILPKDLVMVGAEPGSGKTELLTTIAFHNARLGKRVHFFALEADDAEIERRSVYKQITHLLPTHPNFRDFSLGEYDEYIDERQLDVSLPDTLYTFYRDEEFTQTRFEKVFAAIAGESDLILIDHVHYFDLQTNDENKEITSIVKSMQELGARSNVPIIFAAHLRKIDRKDRPLVPDLSDFMGSSNLQKISKKIITLSSGGPISDTRFITYMKTPKFRTFGAPVHFVCKTIFNAETTMYEGDETIGRVKRIRGEDVFTPLEPHEVPEWLK